MRKTIPLALFYFVVSIVAEEAIAASLKVQQGEIPTLQAKPELSTIKSKQPEDTDSHNESDCNIENKPCYQKNIPKFFECLDSAEKSFVIALSECSRGQYSGIVTVDWIGDTVESHKELTFPVTAKNHICIESEKLRGKAALHQCKAEFHGGIANDCF